MLYPYVCWKYSLSAANRDTQWICSLKYLLFRKSFAGWEIWKNSMSMEGNCCLEIDNSGCLRGFNVKNSCYVLFVKNLFAQPRPQGFSRPTHFLREKPWGRGCSLPSSSSTPSPPSNEGLNFALWPQPNWPVMRLQVVGAPCWLGTLPSVLLGVRNI